MASSSLSSLSSILSNPQGCSLCFKASTRRTLSLAFVSSKLNHSSSSSSALLPRCYRLTQNSIKRKKGFALDLSRSFSVSQTKFDGPSLHQFISKAQTSLTAPQTESECTTQDSDIASPSKGRIYHETYGCQMNINDMEIVLSIMNNSGYKEVVTDPESAEVIFINTCAIRDNAEQRVWQRLNYFWFLKRQWKANVAEGRAKSVKPPKVVVLGCMAERLKDKILDSDKMVDVVCGPDAYRDLPRLLEEVDYGQKGINTLLSLEETYADITPVRISQNAITAFVSVMRGCNNMCAFCIVPFTRGRERSRPVESIVREVKELWEAGVKEVTLLGQNVNSYNDDSSDPEPSGGGGGAKWEYSEGFSSRCKVKNMGLRFADLLDRLSLEFPEMRFRFTSPHPKDYPDDLLYLMRDRHNICNLIHLPAQSGNSRILERMKRGYTREAYLDLVKKIRSIIPDVAITSDFITGFCGETEEEHQETLSLVRAVGYDMAYMFAYSMREKTHAHRQYTDDVPEEVKQRRLTELIQAFRDTTGPCYDSQVGSVQLVLVEGPNKRAPETELIGKTDKGHRVSFVRKPLFDKDKGHGDLKRSPEVGDFVEVKIERSTRASLYGEALAISKMSLFHDVGGVDAVVASCAS
ncbi:unnamed protein product [Brassica napus]|uniref:(rape) hypothetical protein n=1 Tax=Brassica napus TaxID=3708 RepID=A0A816XHI9_BRANA|nr:unnamed protein product [Brassica napus]